MRSLISDGGAGHRGRRREFTDGTRHLDRRGRLGGFPQDHLPAAPATAAAATTAGAVPIVGSTGVLGPFLTGALRAAGHRLVGEIGCLALTHRGLALLSRSLALEAGRFPLERRRFPLRPPRLSLTRRGLAIGVGQGARRRRRGGCGLSSRSTLGAAKGSAGRGASPHSGRPS